ncbi:MAG: hypothetical protein OXG17_04785, partial [Chloroflexi bacterium]|nr:hypothetical protein [Chloroflexota bacterium]
DEARETKCINYAIDLHLGIEYRPGIVERALNWRKKASPEAQHSLRTAINASNFSVQGFRSTSAYNAPPGRLLDQVIERMPTSNDLTGAILRVWIESQDVLHANVVEYRKKADLPIQEYVSGREFPGLWDFDEWNHETDVFVESNGEYSDDDAALMLCCVSGNMPQLPPDDLDDGTVLPEGSLFAHWIEYLKQLSPYAVDWQETENFISEVREISQAKVREAEEALAATLARKLAYIEENFLDDLKYLEAEINAWSEIDTSKLADVSTTLDIVDQLGDSLLAYCRVRLQAATRSEEDARLAKRSELEPRILSLIDQVSRHISGDWNPDDDTPPPDAEAIGHSNGDSPEGGSDSATVRPCLGPGARADGAVSANPSDVTEQLDSTDVALQADHAALQDKHEKIEAERQKYEQQVKELQLDTQSLKKNEDDLRRKLYEGKENYRALQSAYVAIRRSESGPTQSPGGNGEDLSDIKAAVELAGRSFEDRLLFALNSKSEKNPGFEDTTSVWKAFEWLATEYYDSRRNGFDGIDSFDESCREACGLWYKPKQSDTAKGKYPEHYTTKVGSTTYTLDEHIGRGSGDPRSMIRIGFDWDKNMEVVVVGYIGRHPRTDES